MKDEILKLEKAYWSGMENHELEVVTNLTYFPCILASKNGPRKMTEEDFKKVFEQAEGMEMQVNNIDDVQFHNVSEELAVIAYSIELTHKTKDKEIKSKCACSSTWLKSDNAWKCIQHSEADLPSE